MKGTALLVCLALWGCGDDGGNNHPPDAPRIDADPVIDTPPATEAVTITVTDGPNPVADVPVYFQAADSSLVAMKMTDATGTASQVMDAGGYVTVLDAFFTNQIDRRNRRPGRPPSHDLHTFAGVKPGDHLVLPRTDFSSTSVDLTLPAFAGALDYLVHYTGSDPDPLYDATVYVAPPNAGSPTTSVDVHGNHATADFLVYADDDDFGQYAFIPNKSTSGPIDLSSATYTQVTDVTFGVTGIPSDVISVFATNYLVSAHGLIYQSQGNSRATSSAATVTLHRPTPPVTSVLQLDISDEGHTANSYVIDWKPAAATTTIDATNRRLKPYATAPLFDAPTHAVTWTEAGTGADGDASIVSMSGYRGTDQTTWEWEMVAAHSATGAVFPVLPTGVDKYNAQADDSLNLDSVRVIKAVGGYDALRAVSLGGSLLGLATAATGQISLSQWPWIDPRPAIVSTPLGPVGQFLENSLRTALH